MQAIIWEILPKTNEIKKFSVDKRYLSTVSLPLYLASGLYLVIFVPLSNVLLPVTCHLGIFPVMSTCRLGTFLVTVTCRLGTFLVTVTCRMGTFLVTVTCRMGTFLVTVTCRLGTFLVTVTCRMGTFPVMVTGIFPGMLTCHLGFFLVTVVCGTSDEISGSPSEQTSFRTIHI